MLTRMLPVWVLMAWSPSVAAQSCPAPETLSPRLGGVLTHVRYLADDALEGRRVATAGERCAAAYLVARFHEMGLEPGGVDGSYHHSFPVRTGTDPGSANTLLVAGAEVPYPEEWTPLGLSASTSLRAPLVYAGYGVSSPGTEADRGARVDVGGRIAVVEWGDPDAPGRRTLRADPAFKARVAAGRGAAGLLVLLPEATSLPDISAQTDSSLDIPVALVRADAGARVRIQAQGGASAAIQTDVTPIHTDARNVVAVLPGRGPNASEYIVVGAHYDHLGASGDAGLPPGIRTIHNGADDNASGTAALLEVAARLAHRPLERSILFVAFTGEEQGLWGARAFVDRPTVPLDRVVAMLNLDMVGRLEDGPLTVHGTGTADLWPELLRAANATLHAPLRLATAPGGSGPSDHAVFHAAGVPVLHFFTGLHSDYHQPSDTWDRVDGAGLERVVALVTEVVRRLAVHEPAPARPHTAGTAPLP